MNENTPVPQIVKAFGYDVDTVRPNLVKFDLNMSSGVLLLTFDETVNGSSVDPSAIQFLASRQATTGYSLKGMVNSQLGTYSTVLTVEIQEFDLNELKRLQLCTPLLGDCFVACTDKLVIDTSTEKNIVVPRLPTGALSVQNYVKDTVQPRLLSTQLNMSSNELLMYFSEVVNVTSLDISTIRLQTVEDYALTTLLAFELIHENREDQDVKTRVQFSLYDNLNGQAPKDVKVVEWNGDKQTKVVLDVIDCVFSVQGGVIVEYKQPSSDQVDEATFSSSTTKLSVGLQQGTSMVRAPGFNQGKFKFQLDPPMMRLG
jgi:hypothetical protein